MKKQMVLFATLLLFGSSVVHAQTTAYAYVQQTTIGTTSVVTADGTAKFTIPDDGITMAFDGDNGIMYTTDADAPIAMLPIDDNGGELCADFTEKTTGVSKKVTDVGYATFYSPFQLVKPEGVTVYVAKYDATNSKLVLTEESGIIPAGTGVLLKNAGTYEFSFSESAPASVTSDLLGTALSISAPTISGKTICTLGKENGTLGFYKYVGTTNLDPGNAYLAVETSSTGARTAITLDFGGETTAIENANVDVDANRNGKYIENGRVVILKNNQKFNLNGQEVK